MSGAPRASAPTAPTAQRGSRRRRRLAAWVVLGLVVLAAAADLARPPAKQWSARALLWSIDRYQSTVSPFIARNTAISCRFTPTCSHFAAAAIRADGALVGTARTAWRLLRCGPWTPAGTVDPA